MIAERPQPSVTSLESQACLVAAEYGEMPGLRLTVDQIKRLFSFSSEDTRNVLDYLVEAGVLMEDADHRFCRQDCTEL